MKSYSKNTLIAVVILILIIVSTVIYWFAKSKNTTLSYTSTASSEPIAQVETVRLQKGEIRKTVTAYGMVLPLPDKLKTLSVPYASQVEKIHVNQGQFVEQGQLLITLKPGVDAILQLKQAQNELSAALNEHKLLQQRIHLKLATQQDLVTSQLRLKSAEIMLKNLSNRGIGAKQTLKSNHSGIVYLVNVQQGQIVPAGTQLLQLVDQNQWVVRLGVEPEDYQHLLVGQQVLITPVNTSVTKPVKGRIEIITHQIDPSTRLLNVFVRPELNQELLINSFVQGQIIIASVNILRVPLQAVLPDDGGYSLFTIKKSLAVKHRVQIGLENDNYVELIHSDLKEQDEVVVLGNYELEPDMAVSVKPSVHTDKGVSQ